MANNTETNTKPTFNILGIYVKDFSFESPAPHVAFKSKEWKPNAKVNIKPTHKNLEDNIYTCSLVVNVEVMLEETKIFLLELEQAADFRIEGLDDERLKHVLNTYCPNIIFPYARQHVSEMITKGGFPNLYLSPVDFESQYVQQLQKAKQSANEN